MSDRNPVRQKQRETIYEELTEIVNRDFVGGYDYLKKLRADYHKNKLFTDKVWKYRSSVSVCSLNDAFGFGEWEKGQRMVRADAICFSYVYNHLAHLLGRRKIEGTIWVFGEIQYAAPRFF